MFDALLTVVHDGGEDDDGHGQREDQEAQLGGARLKGVAQDPETLRVAGKFEDAKHSKHSEGNEGPGHLVVVGKPEADVVGHDGHKVNHAHDTSHEFTTVRRREQPQEVLGREDHDAGSVQTKEHYFILFAAGLNVIPARHLAARHCLYHVCHH